MIGGSKNKGSSSAGENQTWRGLDGGSKRTRINSSQSRKRRQVQAFKLLGVFLVAVIFISAVVWAIFALNEREEPIQITTPSKPVEKILFDTNGVLPASWLGTVVELRRDTAMMEIDIHTMKQQLEAHGQVKSASIERQFPNALKIDIKEHEPVLRMRVMGDNEQAGVRIISREGTIYKGIGYPRATLNKLPFVLPYQHPEGGISPMRGIGQVAELLEDDAARESRLPARPIDAVEQRDGTVRARVRDDGLEGGGGARLHRRVLAAAQRVEGVDAYREPQILRPHVAVH